MGLDTFLAFGKREDLAVRRLLGVIEGSEEELEKIDHFLETHLKIDFHELKEDPERLAEVVRRFFRQDDVEVLDQRPWFDPDTNQEKANVLVVRVSQLGKPVTCFLKDIEEGARREALAMRINNILTDRPVPFLGSGRTMLQLGIPGPTFRYVNDSYWTVDKKREFATQLGMADRYTRLTALSDRKNDNIIFREDGAVVNIDFGAAFHKSESLRRFIPSEKYADEFAQGVAAAEETMRRRFGLHHELVRGLLASLDDSIVETMNAENDRGTYPVLQNPADMMRKQLEEIGVEL